MKIFLICCDEERKQERILHLKEKKVFFPNITIIITLAARS